MPVVFRVTSPSPDPSPGPDSDSYGIIWGRLGKVSILISWPHLPNAPHVQIMFRALNMQKHALCLKHVFACLKHVLTWRNHVQAKHELNMKLMFIMFHHVLKHDFMFWNMIAFFKHRACFWTWTSCSKTWNHVSEHDFMFWNMIASFKHRAWFWTGNHVLKYDFMVWSMISCSGTWFHVL